MKELSLTSHSLNRIPVKDKIEKIIRFALDAVDPYWAVRNAFQFDGMQFTCKGTTYPLQDIQRIWVVGAGKAGYPMANAIQDLFSKWHPAGCIIVKEGHALHDQLGSSLFIREAAHPIPDQRGAKATQEIITLLSQVEINDLVICLISGGGSSLLTAPAAELTLDDIQHTTDLLLRVGAEIQEINQVRKHLDTVKGGGLASLIMPARGLTLILSDVLGDALDSIASGPTVPDPSRYQDALEVLRKYDLDNKVPGKVLEHLQQGALGLVPETAKPGDPCFDRLDAYIIGSNSIAAQAACKKAEALGLNSLLLTTYLQGEAKHAGRFFGSILKQIATSDLPIKRPAMILAGGETTVNVQGSGLGGRNLEFALGSVQELAGLQNICLISLATDGGDGPTDAAGAIVTGDTRQLALKAGLLPDSYLAQNDSYHFFSALNDLLITGPTLTNVNDLHFGFAW